MPDRILLLGENHDGPGDAKGEHGFAALIEHTGIRVLFDTGMTDRTVANADALGVDLTHLDAVALSHNHLDHTGGLMAVLHRCGPTDVHTSLDFFDGSYRRGSLAPMFDQVWERVKRAHEEACCRRLGRDLPIEIRVERTTAGSGRITILRGGQPLDAETARAIAVDANRQLQEEIRRDALAGRQPQFPEFRYIGPPHKRAEYEAAGAVFHASGGPHWLGDAALLTGPIPGPPAPTQEGFFTGEPPVMAPPDPFEHEQFAMIPTTRGWVLLLGCTHRGVENTIQHALHLAEGRPIHAVVGGLHLATADEAQLAAAASALARTASDTLALGHCTGDASAARIGELLGRPITPIHAGWQLPLPY